MTFKQFLLEYTLPEYNSKRRKQFGKPRQKFKSKGYSNQMFSGKKLGKMRYDNAKSEFSFRKKYQRKRKL